MEGSLVEIGSRSVFDTLTIRRLVDGSSQQGRVCARPDPAGPGGCRRAAWGESIVASEVEGRELAVSEKRQNEANLPVVLIIGIL
jgi:hypothetical protein